MMLNSPATKLRLAVLFFLLSSCGRDLQAFETVQSVERLSGGSLCTEAEVTLANKAELRNSLQKDNFQFVISAHRTCLDKFSQSLFSTAQLQSCSLGSQHACSKKHNGDMLSIYRRSERAIEINIWS